MADTMQEIRVLNAAKDTVYNAGRRGYDFKAAWNAVPKGKWTEASGKVAEVYVAWGLGALGQTKVVGERAIIDDRDGIDFRIGRRELPVQLKFENTKTTGRIFAHIDSGMTGVKAMATVMAVAHGKKSSELESWIMARASEKLVAKLNDGYKFVTG